MKRLLTAFVLIISVTLSTVSCDNQDDHHVPDELQVQNFIWKGLNLYYYWQDEQPLLADHRFGNQTELNQYIRNYTPVELFNNLKMPADVDRFSVLFSDYDVLENTLAGQTLHHGAEFGLYRLSATSNQVYGVIRYIIPQSPAATTTLQRGTIFYAVNQTPLTVDNYQGLLNTNSYIVNLAELQNGELQPTGESVSLTKTNLAENPLHTRTVFQVGDKRVGYLVYNGFWSAYDRQLNAAMAYFASQNITDFILDLRYNSGGTLTSAQYLASMLTGDYSGQLFAQEDWNTKLNTYLDQTGSIDRRVYFVNSLADGTSLNQLHLNKIYVLTTASTASASELVINGLKPYIDVVQIGTKTAGKNVGSTTLYDSPTYRKQGVNPNHRYAMQPIVFRIANAQGFSDYTDGLVPNFEIGENPLNMGQLGNPSEPLLARALQHLQNNARIATTFPPPSELSNSKELRRVGGLTRP